MARLLYHSHSRRRHFLHWWGLGCFWFVGLIAGVGFSLSAGESMLSLMYSAVQRRVSFVSLLGILLLPFLFSAFAVYIRAPMVLWGVSFLKAFSFAFVSAGIWLAFCDSFWLIRWLLMFSECIILPVLIWFWLHFVSGENRKLFLPCAFAVCAVLLVAAIDHGYISPLLAELMKI